MDGIGGHCAKWNKTEERQIPENFNFISIKK